MGRKAAVTKSVGFCFGVERAVGQVYKQVEALKSGKTSGPIYTYSPIAHNEEVVKDLSDKGVMVPEAENELRALPKNQGTVVIRSHGVSRHMYGTLKERNVAVVGAICPFVKKVHHIVAEHSAAGEVVVIIESPDHPEVEGIKGWENGHTTIMKNGEEADNYRLPESQKLCIISQAVSSYNKFKESVEKFLKKGYDGSVLNTIYSAIQERQVGVARVASQMDVVIVIGGKHPSNTQKLYGIRLKECKDTFYIQTLGDLDPDSVPSVRSVGITAGASTLGKIIEEAHIKMVEQGFAELLKEEGESAKPVHIGKVVTSQIIEVGRDEIILSIADNKSEGVITRDEYNNDSNVDLTIKAQIGREMEAKVIKLNGGVGMISLSYKHTAADRGNKRLKEAFENQEILTAKVAQALDDGLSVEIGGVKIFIPANLVSDSYEKDPFEYAGQDIDFIITEFNPRRRRIIGDRKQLPVMQKAKLKEELLARIQPDGMVDGTVKNVTDFGAFIDLGGADGPSHISEMSWGRVENPKKVFRVGGRARILIKDVQGEETALSPKLLEASPWANAADKYVVGNTTCDRVARVTNFGAFVELELSVDVLLHVSQISGEYVEKPTDVLRIGQGIEAKVMDFNEADHRISLNIRAMLAPVVQDADVAGADIDAMSQYTEE